MSWCVVLAEEANSRWYLLATADQVDAAESKKETSSAVRLETFMQNYLKEHSSELGDTLFRFV